MRCYGVVSGLFHIVTELFHGVTELFHGVAELLLFSVSQCYPAVSL